MLVSLASFESWYVILISVCVILSAAMYVLFCLCWDTKRDLQKHYYVIDENGLHKASKDGLSNRTLFRQFSNFGKLSASNLASIKTDENKFDSDLVDSLNVCKRLDGTMLRLEINPLDCDDLTEEMLSCKSTDSKFTFYSTYPGAQSKYQDAINN